MLRVAGVLDEICRGDHALVGPELWAADLLQRTHPLEQHHVFQQRRRVTAKGWLEVEAETRETWDTWEPWETWGKGEVNLGRRSSEEKQ